MPSSLEVWIPWGWLVWLLKTEAKKALRTSVLSSVVLLPTAANKGRKFSSALLLHLMCLWKHFFIFRSSGQIKFLFGFLLSDFLSVSKQHHSIPLELPDPSLKDDKLLCFFFFFFFFPQRLSENALFNQAGCLLCQHILWHTGTACSCALKTSFLSDIQPFCTLFPFKTDSQGILLANVPNSYCSHT